jgi:DNA-binding protein HU-alpha
MRKQELIANIAAKAAISREKSNEVVNALIDEIRLAVARDEKVNLIGLGTFESRARSERMGKNPQTGQPMKIPARKTVGFKPGKALKDAVN